eukprot:TRINITY_DN41666_c0_g1_i1.p1 TRINITY_DN41666_c0_g1~~TRINITY_DN41666_c0_g1_i1.p1  ORF type:complete len:409 (+),score=82.27 TRINITY_DN41666_c0_g1_i1:39-1265(+)
MRRLIFVRFATRSRAASTRADFPTRPPSEVRQFAEERVVDAISKVGPLWATSFGKDWMLQTWQNLSHRSESLATISLTKNQSSQEKPSLAAAVAEEVSKDWKERWSTEEMSKRLAAMEDTVREEIEGEYWSNLLEEYVDAWQRTDAWLAENAADTYGEISREARAAFIDSCVFRWPGFDSPAYTSLIFHDPEHVLAMFSRVEAAAPPRTPVKDILYTGNEALADKYLKERVLDRGLPAIAFMIYGKGELIAIHTGSETILLHAKHFRGCPTNLSAIWSDPWLQKVTVGMSKQRNPECLTIVRRAGIYDLGELYVEKHREEKGFTAALQFDALLKEVWGSDLRNPADAAVRSGNWDSKWLTQRQAEIVRHDVELITGLLLKLFPEGSIPVPQPAEEQAEEGTEAANETS